MPFCQGTKHNSWLFPGCYGNKSVVILLMLRGQHGIQCMPCSSRITSKMLPEIHTMEKCDFLKYVINLKYFNSLLSIMGTTPCFAGMFSKADNFCDVLFASLVNIAIPKWGQL